MHDLFKEKIKIFIGGGAVGCFAGLHFLFDGAPVGHSIVLEYTAKFFGTIILTFVSGLATVIAHDFYKEKLKHRIFKNKNHVKKQKQREQGNQEKKEGGEKVA